MSRSQPLWISLLGVALLAGFAFVLFYLFGFSEETPPPPAIAPTWSVTTPDALTRSDLATDIAGNRYFYYRVGGDTPFGTGKILPPPYPR